MESLRFLETRTVEQFKALLGVDKIEVKRNPKTGKLFFSCSAGIGAVSSKGIPTKPMLSRVESEDKQFWLLHEESQGGAPVLATF